MATTTKPRKPRARRQPFGKVEPFRMNPRRTRSSPGATPEQQSRFESTLGHEEREAKARADTAEARAQAARRKADSTPNVAGPGRSAASSTSKVSRSIDRASKRFLRLGTANPRQVLMLELAAVLVVQTVDSLAHREMPKPSNYLGAFVVFLVLAFAAELGGDGGARLATGFGALVLVALTFANAPGIVKALQVASGQRQVAAGGG